MHYYKFNISDWQSSTRHLTPEEEGVYFRLINYYYDTEKPIPLETHPVIRKLMLGSHSDIVNDILNEFFVKTEKGYEKERCNELIKEYKKTATKNRKNGALGGRPRKDRVCEETHPVSSGNPDLTESKPKHNPNQEPLTINQEPLTSITNTNTREPSVPVCPHSDIIEIYNQTLPELPSVIPSLWKGERERDLRARWKESKKHQDLEFWKWYFSIVRKSDHHMGRSGRWSADMGWLIKSSNFTKMIERFANA